MKSVKFHRRELALDPFARHTRKSENAHSGEQQFIGRCEGLEFPVRPGIKVQSETAGTGATATRGDSVTIRYRLTLNRGGVVQSEDAATFTLGKRDVIAGLEYGVEGMKIGGHRTFRVSPHLAYRDAGVPGVIPPDAVLVFDVELLAINQQASPGTQRDSGDDGDPHV